jgi:hypothetical protein
MEGYGVRWANLTQPGSEGRADYPFWMLQHVGPNIPAKDYLQCL